MSIDSHIDGLFCALCSKSTSLAPSTRWSLIQVLCQSVKTLSAILSDDSDGGNGNDDAAKGPATQSGTPDRQNVVSQEFRDAFGCHLYMLFSIMFILESEAKISNGMAKSRGGGKNSDTSASVEGEDTVQMRAACAAAMLSAAQSMSQKRFKLWKHGVADESVVVLPCRIAYQMLESATGILARKAASGDAALAMIAATINSTESLLGTILAALMDLMHSYEHMAPLCAELCTLVSSNRLAIESIREVGRLDTSGSGDSGKASGIKFVAPFVCELALRRPQLVLANISHLLPHLENEPYYLRSAILTGIGYIVEYIGKAWKPNSDADIDGSSIRREVELSSCNSEKSRAALLDILQERAHDVSSYTRSAVLKAWIRLAHAGYIPVERIHSVTNMAIERLQDKTVIVRKQSLQVGPLPNLIVCKASLGKIISRALSVTVVDDLVRKQPLHGRS
jgi:condensin complex subunit 1